MLNNNRVGAGTGFCRVYRLGLFCPYIQFFMTNIGDAVIVLNNYFTLAIGIGVGVLLWNVGVFLVKSGVADRERDAWLKRDGKGPGDMG